MELKGLLQGFLSSKEIATPTLKFEIKKPDKRNCSEKLNLICITF